MRRMIFLLSFFLFFSSYSQDISDLKGRIKEAEEEIERISSLLESNRSEQIQSSKRVELLEKRLKLRQNLLADTYSQIVLLEKKLKSYGDNVLLYNDKLDTIRMSYRDYILFLNEESYKSQQTDRSFDSYCLQLFTYKIENEIDRLDSLITSTGIAISEVSTKKSQLQKLQEKRNIEVKNIISESEQLRKTKIKLKEGESSLISQLDNQRAKINELQHRIEELIAMENKENYVIQKEDSISRKLISSKGKLPSPLAVKGEIIDYFGIHDHPSIKGVKVSNKGINITFQGSSSILSVFEGEVKGVYSISGMGYTILIRHGSFISVYANLSSVVVKKNQIVAKGQKIASIESADKGFLHFEIWKESVNLNPIEWINFK